jgi:hypothetical protein
MIGNPEMDEAQWLTRDDADGLLDQIWFNHRPLLSARKSRLFVCECARRVWDILPDAARRAIELAERYAEAEATGTEVDAVYKAMSRLRDAHREPNGDYPPIFLAFNLAANATMTSSHFLPGTDWQAVLSLRGMGYEQIGDIADVVRCLYGNPFRQPPPDASWAPDHATRFARGMYETRNFAAMPILADLIEEAGCSHQDVLDHCRGPGPHVRGCWVVDLLLGK